MKFCPECGYKLSGEKFCPECGYRIKHDDTASSSGFDQASSSDSNYSDNDLFAGDWLADLGKEQKAANVENQLSPFEYATHNDGTYTITGMKDKYALRVKVPCGVVAIADEAFLGSSVMEVTLPEGLLKIGKRAFAECAYLESVNIPASVRIIDDEAFFGCSVLALDIPKGIRLGKDVTRGTASDNDLGTERDRVAKAEDAIGNEADAPEAEEKPAKAKKTVKNNKTAENSPAADDAQASAYTVGLKFRKVKKGYKVSGYTGNEANVIIPSVYKGEAVIGISVYAFSGCTVIESIKIPGSVEFIDTSAFTGCTSLKSITFGEGIQVIGLGTFRQCTALENIVFPNSLRVIGRAAFYECFSLKKIVLGESVEKIYAYAFAACRSLSDVTFGCKSAEIEEYAFAGTAYADRY